MKISNKEKVEFEAIQIRAFLHYHCTGDISLISFTGWLGLAGFQCPAHITFNRFLGLEDPEHRESLVKRIDHAMRSTQSATRVGVPYFKVLTTQAMGSTSLFPNPAPHNKIVSVLYVKDEVPVPVEGVYTAMDFFTVVLSAEKLDVK